MKEFLRTHKTKIVNAKGRPVILKGVNLGGWLMMEGYILHAPNFAEQIFKKNFAKALGKSALASFEKEFRGHFIREKDFKTIAGLGFNCIRLPFHYRLVEKRPYRYDAYGLLYLDRAIRWARKYRLWLILDLHAAPGAQNYDWHSDSLGEALLWKRKDFQERTFALWEFLAARYKNEPVVAGYDLLNESVTENTRLLNAFYKNLIKRIRKADRNHILFVEGNRWAVDLKCLERFDDDNYALSIHAYQPLDFTFNFVRHLKYPFSAKGARWNRDTLRKMLAPYRTISQERSLPIFVGEFGVNDREGYDGEDRWVRDMLSCFKEFGFHWTYWTYKAIKNSIFPDGIFSLRDNPPWVNRQGPLMGWDTYSRYWTGRKKEIIRSWHTGGFNANTRIVNALTDAAE